AGSSGAALWESRNAWSFVVTPTAVRFAARLRKLAIEPVVPWQWHYFAAACGTASASTATTRLGDIVDLFFESYDRVQRRAGHTPFESVALLTMVRAMERGLLVEIG